METDGSDGYVIFPPDAARSSCVIKYPRSYELACLSTCAAAAYYTVWKNGLCSAALSTDETVLSPSLGHFGALTAAFAVLIICLHLLSRLTASIR